MMRFPFLTAILALVLLASPAAAASDLGRFWHGFKSFWAGIFGSLGGIVGVVVVAGVMSVFIITRGKWLK